MKIKTKVALTSLLFLLACKSHATKVYTTTEIQHARLDAKQARAQLAKQVLDVAQSNFNKAFADLQQEANVVETENKWSPMLVFNPDTLVFTDPPTTPAPAKQPEAKK